MAKTLGQVAFANLPRLLWRAVDHFNPFQTYLLNWLSELSTSRASAGGVVYGCQVSVVSGLQLQITAGLVIFPNGQMVGVPAQAMILQAADPSNPRIDRLELAYSLANNSNVTNIDGTSVVFDQVFTGTLSANKGTAAATPAAPGLTPGSISLAAVTVGAGVTILNSGNIDNTEDTNRQCSYLKFWDGLSGLRFNMSKSLFELTEDGSTWLPIERPAVPPISMTLANNQSSAANVTGLLFDKTKVIEASMKVCIYRKTDSPTEFMEDGVLKCTYKAVANAWECRFTSDFDDAGVTFSITSGGQVQYTSTNLAGANYVGKLRIRGISTQPI